MRILRAPSPPPTKVDEDDNEIIEHRSDSGLVAAGVAVPLGHSHRPEVPLPTTTVSLSSMSAGVDHPSFAFRPDPPPAEYHHNRVSPAAFPTPPRRTTSTMNTMMKRSSSVATSTGSTPTRRRENTSGTSTSSPSASSAVSQVPAMITPDGGGGNGAGRGFRAGVRAGGTMIQTIITTTPKNISMGGRSSYREERLEQERNGVDLWEDFPPSPSSHTTGSFMTLSTTATSKQFLLPDLVPCGSPLPNPSYQSSSTYDGGSTIEGSSTLDGSTFAESTFAESTTVLGHLNDDDDHDHHHDYDYDHHDNGGRSVDYSDLSFTAATTMDGNYGAGHTLEDVEEPSSCFVPSPPEAAVYPASRSETCSNRSDQDIVFMGNVGRLDGNNDNPTSNSTGTTDKDQPRDHPSKRKRLSLCLLLWILPCLGAGALVMILLIPWDRNGDDNNDNDNYNDNDNPSKPNQDGSQARENASLPLCSLTTLQLSSPVTAAASTLRISNDYDDNPYSWGIVTMEDFAEQQQRQERNDTISDDDENWQILSFEQEATLLTLQAMLAPFFARPISGIFYMTQENGTTNNNIPCFPYTVLQRDTLLWIVHTLIELDDDDDIQQGNGNGNGNGNDDPSLATTYTRSFDTVLASNDEDDGDDVWSDAYYYDPPDDAALAQVVDRMLKPHQYTVKDWLQVYVVALVAKHWKVLGDKTSSPEEDLEHDDTTDKNENENENQDSTTTTKISVVQQYATPKPSGGGTHLSPQSPLNLCGWKGLGCAGDRRLMSLQWNEAFLDLTGTIPTELVLLSHLALLDLSHSPNLVGTIPTQLLGYSTYEQSLQLRALYLEHTGLSGRFPEPPPSAAIAAGTAKRSSIIEIPLNDLRISASPGIQQYGLPSRIFFQEMSQLTYMQWSIPQESANETTTNNTPETPGMMLGSSRTSDTTGTYTAGTIPTELGFLTRLSGLSLDGNGFTGTIPTEIGRLTKLQNLDLSSNYLNSGPLPTEIGYLSRLEWLSLQSSGLQGSLPSNLAELSDLAWLQVGGDNDFDMDSLQVILQSLASSLECNCGILTLASRPFSIDAFPAEKSLEECVCSLHDRDEEK